jgi:hypothetical protein
MADTGEGREIKVRTDAKEEEVVAESKKLLQKSVTARDQTMRRRPRVNQKETPANEPLAEWLPGDSRHRACAILNARRKGTYYGRITEQKGSHR